MRLKITHETGYRYDHPVRGLVQSLRLTPSIHAGQRVTDWRIAVAGGQRGAGFRDGAGDWIEAWTVRGPADEVTVAVAGEVETRDTAGVLRGHRETISPLVYLRPTALTAGDAALRDLAHAEGGEDALDLAHRLSAAVARAIAYEPGVTGAQTSAAQALALGQGVCQDHAHALIACARERDLPARYVSGYLHSNIDGQPHDAAHAWAEIHVGALGWVGFDAANGCCPDDRYVRLGSGHDADDAAPVRGTAFGPGRESLAVRVQVEEMGQEQ
ncbi:Transglutaminase-like enzyme, putative cysteine protease [Paracoccus aminovorans]|uniref:Transglutaminase-like enzyme, putative cysteine protease n=1 Tax=Paracoccus aminovorans TaxID=34004 RepID=A0A1I2XVS3_9RHOB|nr:transglutaminase family protein [Paracoccus aminovorans]CQR87201.1 transglutaminase domain-containing protein [Paracoccus aminovorans]SFH17505.1 Transglutaminase-like enzyme, putative cysteine protease [Paracoccus aminovorans]